MFKTTRWSLVLAARDETPRSKDALAELCRAYYLPVRAYFRKARGAESAEDLTQSFFLALLERRFDRSADRERGRFRAFLSAAMKHFLANELDLRSALKRGGATTMLQIEDVESLLQGPPSESPERSFDRLWAWTVLARAMDALRREADSSGKRALVDRLQHFLSETPDEDEYRRTAEQLNLSRNALWVTVHRLRRKLRNQIRAELAQTVDSQKLIEEELAALRSVLASP